MSDTILGSGRGQAWQATDATSFRALNTGYGNEEQTKLIVVSIDCAAQVGGEAMAGYMVGGVNFDRFAGHPAGVLVTGRFTLAFVVLPGQSYRVNSFVGSGAAVTLAWWMEIVL